MNFHLLFICACSAAAECQVHMGLDFFLLIDNPWIQQGSSTVQVDMDPESKYSQP